MVVKDEGVQDADGTVYALEDGRRDGEQGGSQEAMASFGQVSSPESSTETSGRRSERLAASGFIRSLGRKLREERGGADLCGSLPYPADRTGNICHTLAGFSPKVLHAENASSQIRSTRSA